MHAIYRVVLLLILPFLSVPATAVAQPSEHLIWTGG